jgi:YggT family protein
VSTLFDLYILIVLLRFLLQVVRADFYNPISQAIVQATAPVLNPMRRLIPSMAGLDVASLVLAWLLMGLELFIIGLLRGHVSPLASLLWGIPSLVNLLINVLLFAIIIRAILSWIPSQGYNPFANLAYSLSEPLLRPARNLIPPTSGLDLSPMLALIGLILLEMLLLPPLKSLISALL